MLDNSRLKIWEKSRRIGASWCEAAASVLAAVEGRNTIYLSYNLDMTATFIADCAGWAKAFNLELSRGGVKEILDENRDILGYRVRFKNGKTIQALSSKPNNIRSKQARVVIDEAAFCQNFPELLKAAKALLMWGGQLIVLSTHDGVDNEFNLLCEAIRQGGPEGLGWSLHRTDIHQAIADGLFRRICQVDPARGAHTWSPESEAEWLAETLAEYGVDAEEELLCIPFSGKAGKVFDVERFGLVSADEVPPGLTVRFWDLAATEKDLTATARNTEPCYTAGVKVRLCGARIFVLDVIAVQISAGATDRLIADTARADGHDCLIRWELEGGSSGKRDAAHITALLAGYDCAPVRPQGDKVKRARPFASQLAAGHASLVRAGWNKQYKKWLHSFPDGKVKDPIDATSGAYGVLAAIRNERQQQHGQSGSVGSF